MHFSSIFVKIFTKILALNLFVNDKNNIKFKLNSLVNLNQMIEIRSFLILKN